MSRETETERSTEEEEEAEAEKPKETVQAERAEEEEDIVEERVYMVPLSRAWIGPRNKRAPRAVRILRSFIMRHMKVEEDSLRISNEVNERLWSRGIQKPPRRIRVRAVKDTEGVVTVRLAEGD